MIQGTTSETATVVSEFAPDNSWSPAEVGYLGTIFVPQCHTNQLEPSAFFGARACSVLDFSLAQRAQFDLVLIRFENDFTHGNTSQSNFRYNAGVVFCF